MADQPGRPGAKLVITADDYGYWPSYNDGIIEAIDRGVVDSVSVMVERDYADREPLLERGVEVGLHLEFEGRWGRRSGNAARRALEVQLDRFSRQFGFWPSYIDGHHHCHARPEMVSHVADLAIQLHIPVRSVSTKHRQLLRERGIRTQDHLIGRISPDEELPDTASMVNLDPGVTIWFTHPGYPDPKSGSDYDAAREEDLDLLLRMSLRARSGSPVWGDAERSTLADALAREVFEEEAEEEEEESPAPG
jgi:predicted glycoside hydrolase/deacetylase ChbG (UPF0249 family)